MGLGKTQATVRIGAIVAFLFLAVLPAAAAAGPECSDRRISAKAISNADDIQAFVECAAEYVREHGTEEAHRAFVEDERWYYGPIYIFVTGVGETGNDTITYVFPPQRHIEGNFRGPVVDTFGTDYYAEAHRILSVVDAGWIYYAFINFTTGRDEPKRSYLVEIDWNGERAVVGAGYYANDLPGTCESERVNAGQLSAAPTDKTLQEFVRCAALMVESKGYFAKHELQDDPRWRDGSTYVYVMDMMGNQLMTSNRLSVGGRIRHEWGERGRILDRFGGRDVLSIADSFGESYIYYNHVNPVTLRQERKVGMLKRVVSQGVPVFVGSGYYPSLGAAAQDPQCEDDYIAAGAVQTRRDLRALVNCAAEYISERGPEEAYRSFHEDPRWDDENSYVFVRLLERDEVRSQLVAYPPDATREGIPGEALHDVPTGVVGDYLRELHRLTDDFDSGWLHYYFTNWETGMLEPKTTYVVEVDWRGQAAAVAAGIIEPDLPGTCPEAQVNAATLDANQTPSNLRAFVRCAAFEVEEWGHFAAPILSRGSRWTSPGSHVVAIDVASNDVLFSGEEYSIPFASFLQQAFGPRDVVRMVDVFGEAHWYYMLPGGDPEIAFLKRVLVQGQSVLVGSSYQLPVRSPIP